MPGQTGACGGESPSPPSEDAVRREVQDLEARLARARARLGAAAAGPERDAPAPRGKSSLADLCGPGHG